MEFWTFENRLKKYFFNYLIPRLIFLSLLDNWKDLEFTCKISIYKIYFTNADNYISCWLIPNNWNIG